MILFGWIYLSLLAGFHKVELGEDGVTLRFVLPSTRVDLPWSEIGEVRREPSFRGRWRLVFYRPHGARLASANGSYREVKRAGSIAEGIAECPVLAEASRDSNRVGPFRLTFGYAPEPEIPGFFERGVGPRTQTRPCASPPRRDLDPNHDLEEPPAGSAIRQTLRRTFPNR